MTTYLSNLPFYCEEIPLLGFINIGVCVCCKKSVTKNLLDDNRCNNCFFQTCDDCGRQIPYYLQCDCYYEKEYQEDEEFKSLIYWYNFTYTMYHYASQKDELFEKANSVKDELYPLLKKLYSKIQRRKINIHSMRLEIRIAKLLK